MSNSKTKSKPPASGPNTYTKPTSHQHHKSVVKSKQRTASSIETTEEQKKKSSASFDSEIDTLFASKKQSTKLSKLQLEQQQQRDKAERQRIKLLRLEEEADEFALRGASSSSTAAAASSKKGGDTSAPRTLHAQAVKLNSLSYTRSDLNALNDTSSSSDATSNTKETTAYNKWASDGLGGIFNGEGYTGRKDEGGHRVFKAHLMNREGFGRSKDCPFDCDCCYI